MEVLVFDDKEKINDFLAGKWLELSREAIEERGFFAVALSGGRTPVDFYRKLSEPGEIDWSRTHIFLADERLVPDTGPDSNLHMIKETLLAGTCIPAMNIHAVSADPQSPQSAAERYEKEMAAFFRLEPGVFPRFDLILLGIGPDGHTASIFPGSDVVNETRRLACPVKLDNIKHERVTLTLPVINNARNVVFLVTGNDKAAVLKNVIERKDPRLPAALVGPANGKLLFVLDREASPL